MKRTRKQVEQILDRSLGWHGNPSRSEVQSAVSRVWESLPAQESVEPGATIEHYPSGAKSHGWRLAAAAAVLLVVSGLSVTLIRSFQPEPVQPTATDAGVLLFDATAEVNVDALLMDEVNAHISRTIPAPMEPIMALIPIHKDMAQSGGTQ